MFSSPYKAAVVQMNSQTDWEANFKQAYDLIKQAVEEGAKLVGLPENFAFLGGLDMKIKHAGEIAEDSSSFLSDTAEEFGIYLVGGSYPVPASEGKIYNHATLYGPGGEELISYNKIHLFDVELSEEETYRESDFVEPGKLNPIVYDSNVIGNWGLSVCYDLRFPELYRKLTAQGAEILSVPSAFTFTTGQNHWKPMLRARAIENTSYIFAPAQTGVHGKNRKTWGHAMIINPWGKVIADAGEKTGIALAEINPEYLQKVRSQIPSLKHRRF